MGILKSLRKKKAKKNLLEKNKKDLNNDNKDDNTRIVQNASTVTSSTAPLSPDSVATHALSESPALLSLRNSEYAREREHPLAPNSKSRSPPVVQFSKKNIIIEHETGLTETLSAADSDRDRDRDHDGEDSDSFDETLTYDASTVATSKTNSSDTSLQYLWRYLTCDMGTKSTFDLLREADDLTIESGFTDLTDKTEKSGNGVARRMHEL